MTTSSTQDLHHDSFVIDYMPNGEPFFETEPSRKSMVAALKRNNGSLVEGKRALIYSQLAELESDDDDFRLRVKTAWKKAGVNAVIVTLGALELELTSWESVIRDIGRWTRRTSIAGDMELCRSAWNLREAFNSKTVGVLMALQDAAPIERDLRRLETLYDIGVRIIQLTYNTRNLVGDGCTERHQSGLSRFGVDLVNRMNELGVVVDVSHSGLGTTLDAIEVSRAPVAITHASCEAVATHPRAKSDEEIRALSGRGGFMGILAVPFFLKPEGGGSIDDLLRHLEHAAGIIGLEHLGIATDWGSWAPDLPDELRKASLQAFRRMGFRDTDGLQSNTSLIGFEQWTDWPNVTQSLKSNGYSDLEVQGLLGGNWLRFLEGVEGCREM